MKRAFLLLMFVFALAVAALAPTLSHAQTPTDLGAFKCDWTEGTNYVQGGSYDPLGSYAVWFCKPADKYGDYSRQIAVVRPGLMSSNNYVKLQNALMVHDTPTLINLRDRSVTSAELAAIWTPDIAKIRAATPAPVWTVKANAGKTNRPVYALANGVLGAKLADTATVGIACKCDDTARRYETTTSTYCAFAKSQDDYYKRIYTTGAVTICGSRL